MLLEGPPGTGKSTLLRAVADELGLGFEFVEGNAELTPARLVGHFDPARVLTDGYDPDVFVDGPLVSAMRDGSLLYVEEINRIPEETLNVLITVMSERELHVPRYGRVPATDGFRLVAAMNPFDAIGTARISSRCTTGSAGWPSATRPPATRRPSSLAAGVTGDDLDAEWLAKVVEVVRRTREHPEVRIGSSVRGAIDTVAVARSLAGLRGVAADGSRASSLDAAIVALAGRLRLREGSARKPEDIVTEIWLERVRPRRRRDGQGKAAAPAGAHPTLTRRRPRSRRATPPTRPSPTPRSARCRDATWRATRASSRSRRRSASSTRPRWRRGCPRIPTRRWRCSPTSPGRPTRSCASWPVASPPSCSSTSPAAARRGRAASARCASCRTSPTAATSTSTPAWRRSSRAGPAGSIDAERLRVRGWVRPGTALCLLVDRSGSMGGKPLATAAIAAAAVASRGAADYSVLAFGKDVVVAKAQDADKGADRVVGDLLALRGFGTTDVAGALQTAAAQLGRSRAARKVAVLLSDCRATVDGDPVAAARGLDELVVIAPEEDSEEAAAFAAAVGAGVHHRRRPGRRARGHRPRARLTAERVGALSRWRSCRGRCPW